MVCINCRNEHNYKFCPDCGEKSELQKITFSSLLNDGFTSITNMDQGFLFNIKNLIINPNKIVNDYINGKRKHIFNPVSFLIITITIYLIGESLFQNSVVKKNINSKIYAIGYETGIFIFHYIKYFWILSIIWLSLASKAIFSERNYAEHLAINSFVLGQSTLFGLFGYAIFRVPLIFNPFIYILITWMTYQIFKTEDNEMNTLFKSVASTFLFFIQLILITLLIGIIRS